MSPSKGHEDDREWEHLWYEEWLRELGLCSLWRRQGSGRSCQCVQIPDGANIQTFLPASLAFHWFLHPCIWDFFFFCFWPVDSFSCFFFKTFSLQLQMQSTHVQAHKRSVEVRRIPVFLFYLLLQFNSSSDVKHKKLMSVIPSASWDIAFLRKRNMLRLIPLAHIRELIYIISLCSALKQSHTTSQPLF